MGIWKPGSNCSCSASEKAPRVNINIEGMVPRSEHETLVHRVETLKRKLNEARDWPNPNPRNFKFVKIEYDAPFIITMINYPDCTNWEGNKILVFDNVTLDELANMDEIDPHFCDGDHKSPIARFEPTKSGWAMAKAFVKGWKATDNKLNQNTHTEWRTAGKRLKL